MSFSYSVVVKILALLSFSHFQYRSFFNRIDMIQQQQQQYFNETMTNARDTYKVKKIEKQIPKKKQI